MSSWSSGGSRPKARQKAEKVLADALALAKTKEDARVASEAALKAANDKLTAAIHDFELALAGSVWMFSSLSFARDSTRHRL